MPVPPLKRVEELFNEAVALPSEHRPAFLAAACGDDAELLAAVQLLLRHDADSTDILRAGPLAREADVARQLAPTLPAQEKTSREPLPQIPGYEVVRVLGRGGMGVVYLALHRPLKRLVALKMLPSTPATPEQLARFRTEAEALARLHHPNIVPIYDVSEWEGHPYFTMEYVAGPSLADLMDGRPKDVAASASLVETLARAVHAVHQCGIVHRDIKPANVLFSREESAIADLSFRETMNRISLLDEGVPKLTDFGIAKDRTSPRHLTQPDTLMGTPCYMAPEQVRNSRSGVGPGADVYALGSILYELLTGRPPFDAPTSVEVIAQLLNLEPLSPSRLRPRLPVEIVTICLKCLEKSPRRRYASAQDLAEDLRRFRVREPIRARPVGAVGHAIRWCIRRPLVAGLLTLSACLSVALVVTLLLYDTLLSEKVREEQQQVVQLNVTIGVMEMDQGDNFAAVLRFSEAMRLDRDDAPGRSHRTRIADALRKSPRLLRMRGHDGRVLCTNLGSSGGRAVTLSADHTLEVWDVPTGESVGVPLKPDDEPARSVLSPDGQSVATISLRGRAEVWDIETGQSRRLPIRDGDVVRLAFSPRNRTLFVQYADSSIQLWDLKSAAEPMTSPGGEVVSAALSDDGRWLFTVDTAHSGQVWDLETGMAAGPSLKLEKAVTRSAISADGRRLALIDADGVLRVWDVTASKSFFAPTPPRKTVGHLAISPNGEQVLTVDDEKTIRVWGVAMGEVHDIRTRDKDAAIDTRFSHDGRFVIVGDGNGERVWDATTGQAKTPPLRHCAPFAGASCSADGSQVVTLTRGGTVCVWELPPSLETERDPSPEEILAERGSMDEILALARLLDSGRINEQQKREALNEKAVRDAWATLHPAQ